MPNIESLAGFTEIGGAPSNKWGSSYSAICKVLEKLQVVRQTYVESEQRTVLADLDRKLQSFHPGGLAEGSPVAKVNQLRAVTELKKVMLDYNEIAKVSALIDKMEKSGKALVRNTAKGLKNFSFIIKRDGDFNALFSGGQSIKINVTHFSKSEPLAIGVLVHEYHHYLTNRLPALYVDEFVAHWKQYLAMDVDQARFDNLNNWLCDDPKGYRLANDPKTPAIRFTKAEDAGTVWTKYKDNIRQA